MPLYIAQSGDLDRCYRCLTHSLTDSQTLKDNATQLLIKYKSGALVTQYSFLVLLIFLYLLNDIPISSFRHSILLGLLNTHAQSLDPTPL